MKYIFNSRLNISSDLKDEFGNIISDQPDRIVKEEPMLFSCNNHFAHVYGGPLTKSFLNTLPADWANSELIIDSRVHMLMPGWYPAIPGYHLDDIPRELPNGQPKHLYPSYEAEHVMALVNGDIAPTEFAVGQVELPEVGPQDKYYKEWHPLIELALRAGTMQQVIAPSGQLLFFNCYTWHKGVAAVKPGWRWFIRATRNTKRKAFNETRTQVQVYLENPMEGW